MNFPTLDIIGVPIHIQVLDKSPLGFVSNLSPVIDQIKLLEEECSEINIALRYTYTHGPSDIRPDISLILKHVSQALDWYAPNWRLNTIEVFDVGSRMVYYHLGVPHFRSILHTNYFIVNLKPVGIEDLIKE